MIADPLAPDMAFNGEHAGCVVEFLADVFTDTRELTTTGTRGVIRLMMDLGTRQLWR